MGPASTATTLAVEPRTPPPPAVGRRRRIASQDMVTSMPAGAPFAMSRSRKLTSDRNV